MKWLRGILLLAALFFGYMALEVVGYRQVVPLGRAGTLREFLMWQPKARGFQDLRVGDRRYVFAYGQRHWLPLMPSGPPAYVFDEAGRLVDWTADSGDSSDFMQRWTDQLAPRQPRTFTRGDVEQIAATQPARGEATTTPTR